MPARVCAEEAFTASESTGRAGGRRDAGGVDQGEVDCASGKQDHRQQGDESLNYRDGWISSQRESDDGQRRRTTISVKLNANGSR